MWGEQIPLFDNNTVQPPLADPVPATTLTPDIINNLNQTLLDNSTDQPTSNQINYQTTTSIEPCRSQRAPQPSRASLHSTEYQKCESDGRNERQDWATNGRRSKGSLAIIIDCPEEHENTTICLTKMKALHNIP